MRGLYIHIPFCAKKCSYCDFVSFGGREEFLPPYFDALKKEALKYKGEQISTVFIGGGTPSLMDAKQIEQLCEFLHKNFIIASNAEFSMEANPKSLTLDKLHAAQNGGINRISVGAQSLSDNMLNKIGRCHTLNELEIAIENIKKAGYNNFNLDLIFALPDQTVEMWHQTLVKAANYDPPHISCYSLILDPSTPMGAAYERNELSVPDEDTERLMYKMVGETLASYGICQYEISNYAKEGYECKHNIGYWQCNEYIGLGCAAHSYYNGARFHNTESLEEYILGNDIVRDKQILTEDEMEEETLMLGFRMNKGISITEYDKKFRCDFFKRFNKAIVKLKAQNLIEIKDERIYLTQNGLDLCDSVVLEFLKEI